MVNRLLLVVIIVALIGLLFSVSRLAYDVYSDMLSIRLNPVNKQKFIEDNKRLLSTRKTLNRLVLFGDSRIALWQDQFQIDGYQVINRGIGGETTAQALLRVENDVILIGADSVIIQIGINDLKSIAFLTNKKDEILQATKLHISAIVKKLQQSGVRVYLMTVLSPSKPTGLWRFLWSKNIDKAISSVNEYIRGLDGKKVFVIDCDLLLNEGEKLKDNYSLDTLHINSAGYLLLSNIVRNCLQQHQTISMDEKQ